MKLIKRKILIEDQYLIKKMINFNKWIFGAI